MSNSLNKENILDPLNSSLNPPSGGRGAFILHLADTTLILAQRNSEWCGHGPILEQDIAITNISLDLLGQARNFYQYAADIINKETENNAASIKSSPAREELEGATEDSLAYLRTEREFKNLLLVEQPNGDWGQTILRQYLFSQFQYFLYQQLQQNNDLQLAAIAAKALKEVAYHVRWSSEWVIRLGDGTEESHQKMLKGLENLWPYTGEFFIPASYETESEIGFDLVSLKQPWIEEVNYVLDEATLRSPFFESGPGHQVFMQKGGKQGIHTEHLGFILAELQYVQRTYPNSTW